MGDYKNKELRDFYNRFEFQKDMELHFRVEVNNYSFNYLNVVFKLYRDRFNVKPLETISVVTVPLGINFNNEISYNYEVDNLSINVDDKDLEKKFKRIVGKLHKNIEIKYSLASFMEKGYQQTHYAFNTNPIRLIPNISGSNTVDIVIYQFSSRHNKYIIPKMKFSKLLNSYELIISTLKEYLIEKYGSDAIKSK